MTSTSALRISLGPFRIAAALVIVACLATAVLVAWLPGAPMLRAALVIGIGAHAILMLRRWALRTAAHAIVGIDLDAAHAVRLIDRSGHAVDGSVQADSYVGAWITTLIVLPEGKRLVRTVAILPDMLPADDFRRLRLLLRLGHGETTVSGR